jgi:hypothetical protein
MPYYYSEPKETYKDAEDTEENQQRGKHMWELLKADPVPK